MEKNTIRALLAMITSKMLGLTLTSFVVHEIAVMLKRWHDDERWSTDDIFAGADPFFVSDELFEKLRRGRVIRNMGTAAAEVYIKRGGEAGVIVASTLSALADRRNYVLPLSMLHECSLLTMHNLLLTEKMAMLYLHRHDEDSGGDVSASAHILPNRERVGGFISRLTSQNSPLINIGNLLDSCPTMTTLDKAIFAVCIAHEYTRYAAGKETVEPDYSDMTLIGIDRRLYSFKEDGRFRRVVGSLTINVPKRHHKLTGAA